jgi:TRAP-type transport system periplasmic protein
MRRIGIALFALMVLAPAARAQSEFKIATLAPEGSSWMKLYHEWANNVEKRTSGRVKIKFFAGGVQGDEREAVQKMRGGLINGAGVTGVGLGQINEEVRVLELPFLFKSYDEIDHVRTTLHEDFQKKFNAKGSVLLGWGDVGWIYIYSNIPIKSKEDIAKTKMWAWTDDPVVRALFGALSVRGVPLGVPDVYTSLQTGVIDACYGSPLSMVALQWYTKVKYQTSDPISMAVGATVVTKKDFDKLSGEDQKVLIDESAQLQTKALATLRKDNERAATKMKQVGLQVVQEPPAFVDDMRKQGMAVWDQLADHMYSKAWLEKIKKILADYRKAHG